MPLKPVSAQRAEHPDRTDPGDCHDERADKLHPLVP